MKTLFEHLEDVLDEGVAIGAIARRALQENEAPTNTTGGVANPDKPMFGVRRVAGVDCIVVDSKTYTNCRFGKKKYARWSGIIEDEALRNFVKDKYHKSNRLMIVNQDTGGAVYIKR